MVNAMRYIRLGVCICILLFVHNQILMADEVTNADSITTEYIRSIYIEKPKCALKLLDVAENKKSMPLRVIDELRSLSYRNLFMNKLAYVYARKSYVLDSVYQKDPSGSYRCLSGPRQVRLLQTARPEAQARSPGCSQAG